MSPEFQKLYAHVGQVFTPGSPINERDLFAGRIKQLSEIIDATTQRGYHAVLYGERGVGKTSLSNVAAAVLVQRLVTRVNCDAGDTFSSLWTKAFRDVVITQSRPGLGFGAEDVQERKELVASLPDILTPDDVRRALNGVLSNAGALFIFDEFDRITDKYCTVLMADTIKSLSDYGSSATILLIGVADSVDELIQGHHSIERALVQIPMPRMSPSEIKEILEKGAARLEMKTDNASLGELVSLSQGLPYITHLLGLHSFRATVAREQKTVTSGDVEAGIKKALETMQQSIKQSYYDATKSQQPGAIYREVLLACALSELDELGFFSAASVRVPLREITGRPYDIPGFARHLKDFSSTGRGNILQRGGESRKIRYRFNSPIMRPYIIMRGFSEGLLTKTQMKKLA
jgi:hypothetical protein